MFGAEELFGSVPCQVLNYVGKLTSAVIALARTALPVLVGEDLSNRLQHRLADEIFRGNHFQAFVLASDFMVNSSGDLWIGLGERAAHMVRHDAILDHG